MKKTICPLLITFLMAGCVAQQNVSMEIQNALEFPFEVISELPEFPRDLSQIHHINILDTFKRSSVGSSDETFLANCPLLHEYIDKVERCALTLPDNHEMDFLGNMMDGDRIFIKTYLIDDNEKDGIPEEAYSYVIYTRDGKFVSKIGESAYSRKLSQRNNLSSGKSSVLSTQDEAQYHNAVALCLDRKKKEAVLIEKNGGRMMFYDYNGKYLRTEYQGCMRSSIPGLPPSPQTYNTQGQWFVAFTPFATQTIRLDENKQPTHKVNLGAEFFHFEPEQRVGMGDAFMLQSNRSDTVWQVLPDRLVARYVYSGLLPSPNGVYTKQNPFQPSDVGRLVRSLDWFDIATPRYMMARIGRLVKVEGERNVVDEEFWHLYDSNTGHAICFPCTYDRIIPSEPISFTSWMLEFPTLTPSLLLPDGTLVYSISAYSIKKEMAHLLDQPVADRKVIITKKDEKFVRSLLPNQMVLFFVKLKKF